MTLYLNEEEIKKAVKEYLKKKIVTLPEDTKIVFQIREGNGEMIEAYIYGELTAQVDINEGDEK